jgi:hypothetical protein
MESNYDYLNIFESAGTDGPPVPGSPFHGSSIPEPVLAGGQELTVQMTADGSENGEGFVAEFTCFGEPPPPPPADPCAPPYADLVGGGSVQSAAYGGNADCRWQLTCPGTGEPLLAFTSFHTESGYDYVNVYTGTALDISARIVELHGTAVPDPVATVGQSMLVQMTSDSSEQGQGFQATFSCVGGTADVDDPSLPAGNGDACAPPGLELVGGGALDGVYDNNADCRWTLVCPGVQTPVLSFGSFDVEADYDHVSVLDGSTKTDAIAKLDGSDTPADLTAAGQIMTVQLAADGSAVGAGFQATFTCSGDAPPPPSEEPEAPTEPENTDNTDPCMEPYVSLMDSGILDGAHGGDADCRWVLSCSAAADVPTLTFESFDTEADYDYVLLLLLLLLLLHFLLLLLLFLLFLLFLLLLLLLLLFHFLLLLSSSSSSSS